MTPPGELAPRPLVEVVAAAVAYIASDEARFMTGSEFVIDLGNLCR